MYTENNKIIAEFMGSKNNKTARQTIAERMNDNQLWLPIHGIEEIKNLSYHKDWNWLMEVVEKIENLPSINQQGTYYLGNQIKIYKTLNTNTHYCEVNLIKEHGYRVISIQFSKESKKEAVYNACVEFIKWYKEL